MIRRSLALLALGLALAAPASEAAAGCCSCAMPCGAPAPITIWGLSPAYGVNQGPVFSGPGYTTLPTYEGEVSTVDYPYVGYGGGYGPYSGYRSYRPYDGGPYVDPFRRHIYRPYWRTPAMLSPYPAYRRGFYRHGFGQRVLSVSVGPHARRLDPNWRYR